ncbi:MAG: T9SS type A sorting domain-containing protein [Candidatus Kapabacteria bacterium]|nr:T9SS type A sorting domain-containing protein [Candidatus Kapabacteria bacterium]
MKISVFSALMLLLGVTTRLHAQMMPPPNTNNGPWNNNLMMRTSTDGNTFGAETKFIDSSGVPSLLKDATGRIIAAFQWFPAPRNSPNWDKVAVRISQDNGRTWSQAQPIVVNGLPSGFQRPFDPTLTLTSDGRIRLFFSSGRSMSMMLDSNIATYSAISTDGVNYTFEPSVRFSVSGKAVIDPAVLRLGSKWYFTAPKGAPQEGAYSGVSDDGLIFTRRNDIPSDASHQWTGNLVEYGAGMRFYGAGNQGTWWSYSADGLSWSNPVNITASTPSGARVSVIGGDPAVVKIAENNYLIMYVGPPTTQMMTSVAGIQEKISMGNRNIVISPNPAQDLVTVKFTLTKSERVSLKIFNTLGQEVAQILDETLSAGEHEKSLDIRHWSLVNGAYFLRLQTLTIFQHQTVQVMR